MSQVFFDVEYAPVGTAESKLFRALPDFILLGLRSGVQLHYPSIPLFSIGEELYSKRPRCIRSPIHTFDSFY